MGHVVDKFSWEDAFPRGLPRWLPGQMALFARRAERFIKANRGRFDVIDAHQGNILHTKVSFGFDGILIIRSVGLVHFYEEWARKVFLSRPSLRRRLGQRIRTVDYIFLRRTTERSFDVADRILVVNDDETAFLSASRRWAHKAWELPNAMSTATWRSLSTIDRVVPRVGARRIVFLGAWGARKGGRDWAAIAEQVWATHPEVAFLFLGTGVGAAAVCADLGVIDGDRRVEVVPQFEARELSGLLAQADFGAFPSYVEGLPIGVLEQLAAGIPVVAYDVPGSRQLLRPLMGGLLVAVGDTTSMANRLVRLLEAELGETADLIARCRDISTPFTWATITPKTLKAYALSNVQKK